MITRETIKTLLACADILDVERMRIQSEIPMKFNDPGSQLAILVDQLHVVISQLERSIDTCERR